jgi:sugar phosphate isomerase/epimerase
MIKLGIQSAILGDLSFNEVVDFAADNGFACVEMMCWPRVAEARKYAGVTHVNVTALNDEAIDSIREKLNSRNVYISGLGYYPNPLDPEHEKSVFYFDHIRKIIVAASRMGLGIVNTFIGADPAKHDDDNFSRFLELWPQVIQFAEQNNVKIAIENCPMYFTRDEWPAGKNLAHSPAIWRKMFDAIPSKHFGLNYDPSHMIWQMMDYVRPIYEFHDRIFHIHIKDAKVEWDKINDTGILTTPKNLHTPKIPGLGDINWGSFFSALYEIGFNGSACIEVEDKAFEGTPENRKISLIQSRNFLRQFITE